MIVFLNVYFFNLINTISVTMTSPRDTLPLFLNCVDSRLEEDGSWYSRMLLGTFLSGSRLQLGTRLRRSLLNDLSKASIVAVSFHGARHEFSRLPGVRESVLDLLFLFRQVSFYAPFLHIKEAKVVPFLFFGPGTFYAKDLFLQTDLFCSTPIIILANLIPGATLRGRLLIKKSQSFGLDHSYIIPTYFGEPWSLQSTNN